MNLIKTGIKGFDDLLGGGFPEGSCILVAGEPGTLKTIFSMEFIYRGAKEFGEPGIYVTLQQSVESLLEQASIFGWDFNNLNVKFIYEGRDKTDIDIFRDLKKAVEETGAKRVVVDSITQIINNVMLATARGKVGYEIVEVLERMLPIPVSADIVVRNIITDFVYRVKKLGCTTILISEEGLGSKIASYIVDGVICLELQKGLGRRFIHIKKMRCTNHSLLPAQIVVRDQGLEVIVK